MTQTNKLKTKIAFYQHTGAVQAIYEFIEDYLDNLSECSKRAQVIKKLKEFNLPTYIPATFDDSQSVDIENICKVTESFYAEKSYEDESWYSTTIYSVSEIQSFLNSIGDNSTPLEYIKLCFNDSGNSHYVMPGRRFRNKTQVIQARNRIVVYNSGGLNI